MASTFSELKIELIGDGEQTSVWGATTNQNLEAIEQAVGGYGVVDFGSDADKTLSYVDSNAAQPFRNLYFDVTASVSLTATRKLVVPAVQKMYIVKNGTAGGQDIEVEISGGSGATIPNGETYILYADGTDVVYAAPGLFYFDEVKATAAPNTTTPVVAMRATGSETNIDTAVVQKGTGSLLAAVPDNTAAGGNKRGANAVDLQTSRASATDVAGGAYSTLSGGTDNAVASGATNAVIAGGISNQNSGISAAIAGGSANNITATAPYSAVGGGRDNTVQSQYSGINGGRENTIATNADYSIISGGYRAAATRVGQDVMASGAFSTADGTAQASRQVLRVETTNDTATRLTTDGSGSANAYNSINLGANSVYAVQACLCAVDTNPAVADTRMWEIKALFKRGTLPSATSLVGSATITDISADSGASGWLVGVTADIVNGAVSLTVTGALATTIRWVCSVYTTEVSNG
jgi:hypothetical protein